MQKLYNGISKIVILILMIAVGWMLICACFRMGRYMPFVKDGFKHPAFPIIVCAIFLAWVIFTIFLKISRCNDKQLNRVVWILFGAMVIIQIAFIYCFRTVQITDAYNVNDQALSLALGQESKISAQNSYFMSYGNNYFVVVAVRLFYRVLLALGITGLAGQTIAFEIVNAVLIDISVVLAYKTIKMLWSKAIAAKVLCFLVLNPFTYTIISWFYTLSYSMPLTIGVVYLSVRIWTDKEAPLWRNIIRYILIAVMSVVGYFLRPTVLIALVAVMICFVLKVKLRRDNVVRYLIFSLIFILAMGTSYKLVKYQTYKYVEDDSGNFPLTHWIMMGLHNDGTVNHKDTGYTRRYKVKQEKQDANIKEIKRTLNEYGPVGFMKHLAVKTKVTWSDGVSSAPMRMKQDLKFGRGYEWIAGQRTDFFALYCQAFRVVTLFLILFSLGSQLISRRYDKRFLFTLIIFGGYLFYLIWEAKGSYSIVFLPFMFVLSVDGAELIQKHIPAWEIKKQKYWIAGISAAMLICTVITWVCGYSTFTQVQKSWKNKTIYSFNRDCGAVKEDLSNSRSVMQQEFYATKEFDTVALGCRAIEGQSGSYLISIRDEQKVLKQTEVSAKNKNRDWIKVGVGKQIPKGRQKYVITITPKNPGEKDSIGWKYLTSRASDQYAGVCTIDGKQQTWDLFIRVYGTYTGPFMSVARYIFILFFTCAGIILCGWIQYKVLKAEQNKEIQER